MRMIFPLFLGIQECEVKVGKFALLKSNDLLSLILGKEIEGLTEEHVLNICETTGPLIYKIYRKVIKQREGVG